MHHARLVLAAIASFAMLAAPAGSARADWPTPAAVGFGITTMPEGVLFPDLTGNVVGLAHAVQTGADFWDASAYTPGGGVAPGFAAARFYDTASATQLAIAPDGVGGLYHAYDSGGTLQLELARSDGTFGGPWTMESTAGLAEAVCPDGLGGTYLAFSTGSMMVQHVNSGGAVVVGWPLSGKGVDSYGGVTGQPVLAPDGSGGVLVMWAGTQVATANVPHVARLTTAGVYAAGWAVNGIAASSQGVRATEQLALVPSDGTHWIAGWVEADRSVHVLRFGLDATTDPRWSALVAVPAADSMSSVRFVADGQGGVFVLGRTPSGALVQHVLVTGTPASGFGAGPLSPLDAGAVLPADALVLGATGAQGGIVVAWDDLRTSSRSLRARWLRANGAADPGEPVSSRVVASGIDGARAALGDGAGGAYLLWSAPSAGFSVALMTRVTPTSLADAPPAHAEAVELAASPNPARGAVVLRFALPAGGPGRLELIDVSGRRVRSLAVAGAGAHAERFDGLGALPAGVYLARVTQGAFVRTARVAIVR